MDFKLLTSLDQLDEIDNESKTSKHGALIFKHSTSCSISARAYNRMNRDWNFKESEMPVYLLDLKRFREVSNFVSEKYQITHESPQLLLIKDGECVWNVSHFNVDPKNVHEEVNA